MSAMPTGGPFPSLPSNAGKRLAMALIEWRDAGAPVEEVVRAILDVVRGPQEQNPTP